MSRRAALNPLSRRLTPKEVAQLWFRRGEDFAEIIHQTYPNFPNPGPDGLFLLSSVEAWFDRFHGRPQPSASSREREEEEAMRAASGAR